MLVLHPVDSFGYSDNLEASLRRMGVLDETWRERRFFAGDRLMRHIAFVGCMPSLRLRPEGEKPFVYIELPAVSDAPLFRFGRERPPRCADCGNPVDWGNISDEAATCRRCGRETSLSALRWPSRAACLARQVALIHGIHRGDAAPTEAFLEQLGKETGVGWDYCFL